MTTADYKQRIRSAVDDWYDAARNGKDKPRRKPQYAGSEKSEQAKVVAWLEQHGIAFHHVPNAGKRNPHTARSQGIVAGTPDLIITDPPPPCGGYRFAAIEMKRIHGGSVSMEQIHWKERHEKSVAVRFCEGAREAIAFLEELGYGH